MACWITKDILFKFNTLELDSENRLGSGQTGVVFRGQFNPRGAIRMDVAVKGMRCGSDNVGLLSEAKVMAKINGVLDKNIVHHPNVVNLQGISIRPASSSILCDEVSGTTVYAL